VAAGIVFSSELQAIVTALGDELRVNAHGMVASALYYWIPEAAHAIVGVHKVAPGTLERVRPDGT
jgi:asparagine synthase (glutamine-hydrolysing)